VLDEILECRERPRANSIELMRDDRLEEPAYESTL
jgi:hypothetical protein